jgi:S-DNA-T family DNA segregation ATPase FtsK/SpoIIIE
MLTMAVFSPMMMLANYMQSRKTGKLTHRQQLADYKDKKKRIEEDVEQALVDERHARRMEAPDPSLCLLITSGPRMRLWERRTSDPDYLSLRLGVGDLVSEVTVSDPEQPEHRPLPHPVQFAGRADTLVPLLLRQIDQIALGALADLRTLGAWPIGPAALVAGRVPPVLATAENDVDLGVLDDLSGDLTLVSPIGDVCGEGGR